MSINGYSWVEGNVVNTIDPTGKLAQAIFGLINSPRNLLNTLNSGLCTETGGECFTLCMLNLGIVDRFERADECLKLCCPSSEPSEPTVVYFGGSNTDVGIEGPTDIPFAQGQAAVWAGKADIVIPYPGVPCSRNPADSNFCPIGEIIGKQLHATNGISLVPKDTELVIIGYSAGADSAVIFADMYLVQQANNASGRLLVSLNRI